MNDDGFLGQIGTTAADSTPWWPEAPQHLRHAPNIVVMILDDTGWSDFGCFGSEIDTPRIDALAAGGVRFNNFHVLPLCSPTRASLLTGCNPHRVGMRFLADADTGFPNSRGAIRGDIATLPSLLRAGGYGTYLAGKWHLTPLHEITPAGPYKNWPLSNGFERYYGFLDGCTDQYTPELYMDNSQVEAPTHEGYHLTEDLTDHALRYIRDHDTFRSDTPFYLQYAVGATHAPFQAPGEYIAKYRDTFRKGWDQTRSDRLTRQIELGVVPKDTELAERNPTVPAWEDLTETEHEVYSATQAAFAGFLEHTDSQFGRILDELQRLGIADNTVVMVLSDNGASREGGPHGDVDVNAPYSQNHRPAEQQLPYLDRIGTLEGPSFYPEGWAMAGNTPFRRYKQFVDLGGIRSPLVVSWPQSAAGEGRVQGAFAHVADIAPTLLDLAGLNPLEYTDGASLRDAIESVEQMPGRQHHGFEMLGHRGLWHEGWYAVTEHVKGADYDEEQWRLYRPSDDFSHANDLAEQFPEKLAELKALWWSGAASHSVMPLDDRTLIELLYARNPTGLLAQPNFTMRPGQGHVPFASAVTSSNRSMRVRADLSEYRSGNDGVLVASGNACSGYTLYVKNSTLVYEHLYLDERVVVSAEEPVPEGDGPVGFVLVRADDGSAEVRLVQGSKVVGQGLIPRTSGHLSLYGLDVGRDPLSPVSDSYPAPNEFPSAMLNGLTLFFNEAIDMEQLMEQREATE